MISRIALLAIVMLSWSVATADESTFDFSGWDGPPVQVRLFAPDDRTPDTPVVIVMHGASRDAPRYYADWSRAGAERGFIVAVPHFTDEAFPGSSSYNLGNVFDEETGARTDSSRWTYAAIEPLFDAIVERTGSGRDGYTLYGHSAGSQFAHRFLYLVPDNRVERAILANAGWYTMPDAGVDWPYGIRDSGIDETDLRRVFATDVVLLLGDSDTDAQGYNLRKTPQAELQGAHRLARGQTFYRVAGAWAASLETELNWQLAFVPGAAHSNAAMTPAAAGYVE